MNHLSSHDFLAAQSTLYPYKQCLTLAPGCPERAMPLQPMADTGCQVVSSVPIQAIIHTGYLECGDSSTVNGPNKLFFLVYDR